jgi:hypothetical protein
MSLWMSLFITSLNWLSFDIRNVVYFILTLTFQKLFGTPALSRLIFNICIISCVLLNGSIKCSVYTASNNVIIIKHKITFRILCYLYRTLS